MVLGAALVIGGRKLEAGKDFKAKRLGTEVGGTYGVIYRTGEKDRGLRSWCISRETWKVDRFP
jgi:hypothetical protein